MLRVQEFLDAPVCQTLLASQTFVKAELVAGFQFMRVYFDGQPPGALPCRFPSHVLQCRGVPRRLRNLACTCRRGGHAEPAG